MRIGQTLFKLTGFNNYLLARGQAGLNNLKPGAALCLN